MNSRYALPKSCCTGWVWRMSGIRFSSTCPPGRVIADGTKQEMLTDDNLNELVWFAATNNFTVELVSVVAGLVIFRSAVDTYEHSV